MTTESDRSASLRGLLRPDGSVLIPPGLTPDVLRRLVRDIVTEARSTGGQPSAAARQLLDALYAAAEHQHARPADEPAPVEAASLTVREMADRMGCSTQHVRKLLAGGKLDGRKSGGVWIVHTSRSVADSQVA